jgi:YidC/Oxa1 family membrane protein insertase
MNSSYGPEVLLFNFKKENGKYMDVLSSEVKSAVEDFDYTFLGMELGKIPTKKDATVMIPIASFILQLLTTIISQIFQKKNNPDMKMQGSMMMMLFLMPLFSLWIGFKFPCALGIYWIYSSMFAVFQVIFLNIVYSPAKLKVIAEKEAEKAKAKRKKKGPSLMERAIEVRNEQGPEKPSLSDAKKASGDDDDDDDSDEDEDVKLSKAQIKEKNRQKLNEARKRYAEKYGDDYTE